MKPSLNFFIRIVLYIALLLGLNACSLVKKKPSEKMETKVFHYCDFSVITASKYVVVHYTQDSQYAIRARGSKNMLSALEVKEDKRLGCLSFEVRHGDDRFIVSDDSQRVHIWITSPTLKKCVSYADGIIYLDSININYPIEIEAYASSVVKGGHIKTSSLKITSYSESRASLRNVFAPILIATSFNEASIRLSGNFLKKTISKWDNSSIEINTK